jgi:hypothetical protein
MTRYQALAMGGLRGLAEWYLDPDAGPEEFDENERYGLLEAFGGYLRTEAARIADEEWPGYCRAYDLALEAAPIDRYDAVSRRLYVMAAMLNSVGPRRDVSLLDPDHGARSFLDALPMSRDEARAQAADWRTLPIADIRRLRKIKNMVTPLITFRHLIADAELSRRVSEWIELRDQLP